MENIKQFHVHLKDNGDIESVFVFFDDEVPPFILIEEGNPLNRLELERASRMVPFLSTFIAAIRQHRSNPR